MVEFGVQGVSEICDITFVRVIRTRTVKSCASACVVGRFLCELQPVLFWNDTDSVEPTTTKCHVQVAVRSFTYYCFDNNLEQMCQVLPMLNTACHASVYGLWRALRNDRCYRLTRVFLLVCFMVTRRLKCRSTSSYKCQSSRLKSGDLAGHEFGLPRNYSSYRILPLRNAKT